MTRKWRRGGGAALSQRNLNELQLKEGAQKSKNKHEADSQQF